MLQKITKSLKLLSFFSLLLLGACSQKSSKPVVFISQIATHPALQAQYNGVIEALHDHGFSADSITIFHENAQGSLATATQIAQKAVTKKPSVMVAIATPMAQSLAKVSQNHQIPLVFTAVTDPKSAKLEGHPTITGVTDAAPIDPVFEMCLKDNPDIKQIGTLYSSSEANAIYHVERLRELCQQKGIELVEISLQKSSDIASAAQSMCQKVSNIILPNDNTVVSALSTLMKVASKQGVNVYASDVNLMPMGLKGAVSFDHKDLGYQAGLMVVKILNNCSLKYMPIEAGKTLKTEHQ